MSFSLQFQRIICAPFDAPFEALGVKCDSEKILSVDYLSDKKLDRSTVIPLSTSSVVNELTRRLRAYFQSPETASFGGLRLCDSMLSSEERDEGVKLSDRGYKERVKVRPELRKLSYRETCSYGYIGAGSAVAPLRVGYVCRKSSFSIVVPCYRVISSERRLSGFSGNPAAGKEIDPEEKADLEIKAWLLEQEGNTVHRVGENPRQWKVECPNFLG